MRSTSSSLTHLGIQKPYTDDVAAPHGQRQGLVHRRSHSDLGWAILHEQHQTFMASVLRTGRHKCAPLAALPPIPRCLVHRRSSVSCLPPPTLLRARQKHGKEATGVLAGAIGEIPRRANLRDQREWMRDTKLLGSGRGHCWMGNNEFFIHINAIGVVLHCLLELL